MQLLQQRNFLTGYFVAGFPSFEESIQSIKKAVENGLDAVEIGIPSQDPFLEGEVIKRAHKRTISHFHSEEQYIPFLKALRVEINVPIWIMGYAVDIVYTNLYKALCGEQLADGFIIPDLTSLEVKDLKKETNLIPVINEDMDEEQLREAVSGCDIVYCQIYNGKTGSEIKSLTTLPNFCRRVRGLTNATLMAGFGVKTSQVVEEVFQTGFDGVVVGSEIVRIIETGNSSALVDFIQELAICKGKGKV